MGLRTREMLGLEKDVSCGLEDAYAGLLFPMRMRYVHVERGYGMGDMMREVMKGRLK